jgi:4-amino-4-deoxy-L-arabinose transferase-like glycosyltransferase
MDYIALPDETERSSKRYHACLIVILLLALVLRLGDFTERWPGNGWQSLGAFFSITGRNFVEQGYLPLKFAPAMNPIPPEDGEWDIYLHHPPLFPILLSFSFQIFGIAEWSARLLAVAGSMVELLLIWAIACRLFGRRVGLVCAALGLALPVTAFYGSHVIQLGSVLMAFSCATFLFHLKHLDHPDRRYFIGLMIMLCATALTDWQGYFMGGVIILHYFWLRKPKEALLLIGTLVVLLLLHVLHLLWAVGSVGSGFGGGMLDIFIHRTWGGIERLGCVGEIFPNIFRKIIRLFTWPVVLLALPGIEAARRSRRPMAMVALVLAGLLEHFMFLEGSMRHDFYNITLAPALIVLAGAGLDLSVRVIALKGFKDVVIVAAVAAIVLFGAFQTHKRFERIENDFFYELSSVIRQHSLPDEVIGTCENETGPLLFYSRRKIIGFLRDEKLPSRGLPESMGIFDKIVIPEVKSKPHHCERILQILRQRKYPCTVVHTPACGDIHIFDVTEGR